MYTILTTLEYYIHQDYCLKGEKGKKKSQLFFRLLWTRVGLFLFIYFFP